MIGAFIYTPYYISALYLMLQIGRHLQPSRQGLGRSSLRAGSERSHCQPDSGKENYCARAGSAYAEVVEDAVRDQNTR